MFVAVMVPARLVSMEVRLLFGVGTHTGPGFGVVEIRAQRSGVSKARIEMELSLHIMVMLWWLGGGATAVIADLVACGVTALEKSRLTEHGRRPPFRTATQTAR